MLKQILKDMYVAPEILAELPEEQKQILFFKIREEQKRRYYQCEKENPAKDFKRRKGNKRAVPKNVAILEDSNAQPWTWVMGEHPNDIPLETLWSNPGKDWKQLHTGEIKSASKVQAIIFAHNKPRKVEDNIAGETKTRSKPNPPDIHDSGKPKVAPLANKDKTYSEHHNKSDTKSNTAVIKPFGSTFQSSVAPSSTSINKTESPSLLQPPVSSASKQPEKSPHDDSDEDLYENWGPGSLNQSSEIAENEWKKQLKRFKEADVRRSVNARRASLQMKRLSQHNLTQEKKLSDLRAKFERRRSVKRDIKGKPGSKPPALPPKPSALRLKHPVQVSGRGPMPASREEAEQWFKETQISEIVDVNDENPVPKWFHGLISRYDAEKILKNARIGNFLIRVSDKIWGYALSYKAEEKVKHFLIDGSEPNCYHFFGNDQIRHPGLEELITFHKDEAISYGNEILKNEVGQLNSETPDYADLIQPSDTKPSSTHESELTQF